MAQVQLAQRTVSAQALREHPERYSRLFAAARTEVGWALCLCRPLAPQRLVIRRRHERYHLAAWPGHGHEHAFGCAWYRPIPELSGSTSYTTSALHETETGVAIRLTTDLLTPTTPRRGTTTTPPRKSRDAATPSPQPRSMSLLGLLHYLWEQAGLSSWDPDERARRWEHCRARVLAAAAGCRINRLDLQDALHVIPTFRRDYADERARQWDAFIANLGHGKRSHRRGLVLGELKKMSPSGNGVQVRLQHLRAPLFGTRGLAERLQQSFPRAIDAEGGARRVVLCLVTRTSQGNAGVDDMAPMLTAPSWLPVESSYELRMAQALVNAKRHVLKPLRYDHTDAVFPDFVLQDTVPATYVEVWGVTGRDDYEQRKHRKQEYYRRLGHPLLEWDVTAQMPAVDAA